MKSAQTPPARRGRVVVGTSGWIYPDWAGSVYPAGVTRTAEAFAFYARHFRTVELNSTFYHFPRETTVANWCGMGGADFTWAVKAWRWITHIKRLHGVAGDLRDFLTRVSPLTTHGVVLFQLPPSFHQDLTRLSRFLARLPRTLRAAVEFRHASWFAPATYALRRKYHVALVGVDAPGVPRVFDVRTAAFSYFRFHGSGAWYRHDYRDEELQDFARAVRRHLRSGDVYVYFDNTAEGHAFHNALAFTERVSATRTRQRAEAT